MQPVTHGETYEEALKNAQEVLELLSESSLAENKSLPEPKLDFIHLAFERSFRRLTGTS